MHDRHQLGVLGRVQRLFAGLLGLLGGGERVRVAGLGRGGDRLGGLVVRFLLAGHVDDGLDPRRGLEVAAQGGVAERRCDLGGIGLAEQPQDLGPVAPGAGDQPRGQRQPAAKAWLAALEHVEQVAAHERMAAERARDRVSERLAGELLIRGRELRGRIAHQPLGDELEAVVVTHAGAEHAMELLGAPLRIRAGQLEVGGLGVDAARPVVAVLAVADPQLRLGHVQVARGRGQRLLAGRGLRAGRGVAVRIARSRLR